MSGQVSLELLTVTRHLTHVVSGNYTGLYSTRLIKYYEYEHAIQGGRLRCPDAADRLKAGMSSLGHAVSRSPPWS